MDGELLDAIVSAYPFLKSAGPEVRDLVHREGQAVAVPADTELFAPEAPCKTFPLVARGVIRVGKIGEKGRELVLYRVNPGEYCVLSLCGLMTEGLFPVYAVVERDLDGIILPKETFERLFVQVPEFRRSVFTNLWIRLGSLIELVGEFAFLRLDQRVAALLLRLSQDGASDEVKATHQAMANQIGTSREIVSRALEMLAAQGMVSLQRGRVILENPEELRRRVLRDA